jgi:pimeloyl-ACP methyl ester carboxylesterase
LFLHGWGGCEYSFINTFNQLKNNFTVVSINLTDITSNYLNKPLTLYDYAVKVSQILSDFNIKNIHIVCHSFGFRVALILNKFFSFNLKSIVIVDGAGVNLFEIKKHIKITYYKCVKHLVKLKILPSKILSKFGSCDYKKLNFVEKQTFKNIVNYNLKKYVNEIDVKATIIWGKFDKDTKLKVAKYLNKNINGSVLKIYNTGHFSYVENRFEFMSDIEEHFNEFIIV